MTSRIGEMLVRSGLITQPQLDQAIEAQRNAGGGFIGGYLVKLGFIAEEDLTDTIAKQYGVQIIELMFELNREHGTTLVLVTHDEALSQRCSRQIRLADGKLVQ